MSELLIFDPADNLLAVLSNEAEEACDFWSAPFREVVNQGSFFEFITQGDHPDSQYIVAENQVAFLDKEGYFRLFVIKEPDQTNGLNGPQIRCVCEPAMNELNDEWIEDVRPYNTTLADAQSRALAGTRWKPGISADLGINSTNYYYISVNEAIQENINTWGGELRDRIEIKDNKIIGRYIDILPRRGQDTGKIWEIDKDILSLSHKVQSYPKTALYGRGASLETDNGGFTRKINFADVEWKVANGDPVDKPKGQGWVGDPSALAAFGRLNEDGTKRHRKGLYENGDQEDPAALLQETWEALQQQKHQFHNYEMDVFLLEEITGYEHEKVRLGDTTFAIDRSFANPIEIEERVISYEYDVADPDNTGIVELGQYIDLYSDDDRLDKVEAQLNDKSGIWDRGGGPVTDDKIENVTPPKTMNVIASGGFQNILVEWDFVNTIYIANYEVYASQIQEFTPDSSNLVFRGKTSTYSHKAETNQQWYFRVRAINTHGVSGELSDEAMAQTARVISDDILFGPEIAEKLRELSETAGILADGSVDLEQIKQDALDAIQAQATQYTDAEILATEQAIMTDLNLRIGNVNSDITSLRLAVDEDIATLNSTANDLLQRVSDNEIGLAAAGGKITTIEQNINTIDGSLSTTISQLSNLDGVVSQQQTTLTAMAGEISAKAEKTEVYTKTEADGKISTAVSAAKAEIKLTTDGLRTDVTSVTNKLDGLQIGGRNLYKNTSDKFVTATWNNQWNVYPNGTTYEIPVNPSETITVRVYYRNVVGIDVTVRIFWIKPDGSLIESGNGNVIKVGEEGYSTITLTAPADVVGFRVPLRRASLTGSGTAEYKELKVEKGNKATDWTPAPEDVDGAISAVQSFASSIDQKADSIQLSVSSLTQTVDSQGTRISGAESSITQLSTSISLKANASDVYTKSQVDTALNGKVSTTTYNNKMSQLDLSISGISGRVSNTEASINDLTGEITSAKSQIASLEIKADGISTSVSEVQADLTSLENNTGNLVNNPAVSGNTSRWHSGLSISNQMFLGEDIPVLQSSSSANIQSYSDWFNVDPSKAYQVSGWFKKSAKTGRVYLGLHGQTSSGATVGFERITEGGVLGNANDTNFYFWYPSAGNSPSDWEYLCVYIMPSGTNPSDMKNISVYPSVGGTKQNAIMKPTTSKIRLRVLNYDNGGTTQQIWFANPKVVEVDPNAVIKGAQAGNAADALNSRVSSAETRIDQNATQIGLKASQTSVDSLTGRMSQAESSINLMTDEISLKVNRDDVIASINLQPGTVKIKATLIDLVGDVYITNGQTQITNLAVGTAAIANAAVTNAKIGNLAVGTAQMQDLAVTNAKIGNLAVDDAKISNVSVSKLKAGTIDTSVIKIFGGSTTDYTTIDGSFFESRGRFNRTWRGSSKTHDIKLRFENGYLRARNDTENRSLYFTDYGISTQVDGINASGTLEFFSSVNNSLGRGVTLTSEGVTTIEANGGSLYLTSSNQIVANTSIYAPGMITSTTNAYIGSDSEVRLVNKGFVDGSTGSPIYRDLRAQHIWADMIATNGGTNLYLGSDSEVRATARSGINGGSPIYRAVRALGVYADFLDSNTSTGGTHVYIRPQAGSEVRFTSIGGTSSYQSFRGLFGYMNAVDINTGTHIYIRPTTSGEAIVTATGTTNNFRPIRARAFTTDTSVRENKKDIEVYNVSALDVFRNANVYTYRRKNDEPDSFKQLGMMVDETPRLLHGEAGDSFDLYALTSFVAKGVKELVSITDNHADDINWLKIENQYLSQKVKSLEQRVRSLEDQLYAA